MKFDRKELSDIVDLMKPIISINGLVEVLQNFCFRDNKILVYNCSVGLIANFDTQGLECLIPFERFSVFVKGCTGDEIDIKLEDDKVYLKSGRSKSTLTTGGNVEDFPDFENILTEKMSPAPDIFTGFKLCEPFAARKGTRFELNGLHLTGTFIEATDARRIARYDVGERVVPEEIDSVIIPLDVVKVCSKFKEIKGMYVDKEKIIFESENYIAFGGIIEGKYPSIDKYFPKVTKFIDLPKDELKKGLTTVGDFTGEILDQSRCEVDFGDTITIKYENSVAEITEVFNFGQSYPEKKMKLNPYHFNLILDNCDLFSFQKDALYGESKDGRFRCILALFVE